jgi:hypothetical protein
MARQEIGMRQVQARIAKDRRNCYARLIIGDDA